jgi:plasmid stability protein
MAYLQIRDVPDSVRDVLAERARERGQSLNMYLREVVLREASFAQNRVLVDQVAARRGGSHFTAEDVLAARDAARDRSDA